MTTMARHALLTAIGADAKTRMTALNLFKSVELLPVSSFESVLARMNYLADFPAALVIIGAGQYTGGSRQRVREMDVNILVASVFDASTDSGAAALFALLDAVCRAWLPATDGADFVTLNGVRYKPDTIQPVPAGADRTAFVLKLTAIDPMQDRSVVT